MKLREIETRNNEKIQQLERDIASFSREITKSHQKVMALERKLQEANEQIEIEREALNLYKSKAQALLEEKTGVEEEITDKENDMIEIHHYKALRAEKDKLSLQIESYKLEIQRLKKELEV